MSDRMQLSISAQLGRRPTDLRQMKRTCLFLVAVLALVAATACQTGVQMWASCTAPDGSIESGTDGTYVLVCSNGRWTPIMTVDEYIRRSQGQDVPIAPLPSPPTTTTSAPTTVPTTTSTRACRNRCTAAPR